jgi:hypothetical protein
MDLENIQRQLDKMMYEQNHKGIQAFEGYSPFEMHHILHFTFESNSPIQLLKPIDSDFDKIPILSLIKYLLELISKKGQIKLTVKGFLPTKVVSELYEQGFIKEKFIESGIIKLYKETDSLSINLTRILIEISRLVKKQHGKLSLTKSGEKIMTDNYQLLRLVLLTFATRFNWAFYDGHGDNQIGQLGYGFSLILLSKYGDKKRLDSFYAQKYFTAFPKLLESSKPSYDENSFRQCYSIRTFDRFLRYFGVIEIEEEAKNLFSPKHIIKTELFDKLFKCAPHKND